jgi:hypothetical protein
LPHTGILLISPEKLDNLVTNFTVRHANIVFGVAILAHEGEEAVVGDIKLP